MIEADYAGLEKLANELKSAVDDMHVTINNLTDTISNVNKAWNEPAANKFVDYMKNKNINSLNKLHDTLSDYTDFLRNAPKAYKMLDEVYSSKNIGG